MAEQLLPKQLVRVRFSYTAPKYLGVVQLASTRALGARDFLGVRVPPLRPYHGLTPIKREFFFLSKITKSIYAKCTNKNLIYLLTNKKFYDII